MVTSGLFFISCDKDFNEIGSDVIGENNFGFERNTTSTVVAFNQPTGVVQSNNLPINALGIYNNPLFGKTKANFVSQVQMASVNPTFDPALLVSLDSVVLTVPYFSKPKSVADGRTTYELDSIAGSGPISLKIFESGYTLLDLDPNENFEQQQKYYTDQDNLFNSTKIGVNGGPLNNDINSPVENTQFVPSAKEYVKFKRNNILELIRTEVESRATPRMSLKLDKDFFMSKIINAPAGSLQNNNTFKNYFKGIYFQVDDAPSGTLLKLDFSRGDITMYYTEHASLVDRDNNPATPRTPETFDDDANPATPEVNKNVIRTFVLNLRGNTVNLIEHTPTPVYANALSTPNPVQGDEKLYIKGGAGGSVALIDLFGPDNHGADGISGPPNGIADELDIIKTNRWLINEANLTFYIDRDEMGNIPEPQRVYLYDVKNKRALIDYIIDGTTTVNPKFNKFVHGGILERERVAGGRGTRYKIRITNHVRNLVTKDSTNVRLGLSVTEAIAITANSRLKNPVPGSIDRLPAASVMNPFGTVLFGSKVVPAVPEDKRLKLEIYYTKPN
jgi:hypothetical protein